MLVKRELEDIHEWNFDLVYTMMLNAYVSPCLIPLFICFLLCLYHKEGLPNHRLGAHKIDGC